MRCGGTGGGAAVAEVPGVGGDGAVGCDEARPSTEHVASTHEAVKLAVGASAATVTERVAMAVAPLSSMTVAATV